MQEIPEPLPIHVHLTDIGPHPLISSSTAKTLLYLEMENNNNDIYSTTYAITFRLISMVY